MRITMDKQYGQAFVNLIRQVSMASVNVVRPIAFEVGASSSVVDSSNSMVEDMTEFISNVSQFAYIVDKSNEENNKPIVFNDTVSSTLSTYDFSSAGIKCKDNKVVATMLSAENIKIVFRNSKGKYSARENVEYLQNNGMDTESLVVIPSRHCAADTFRIKEQPGSKYTVDLTLFSQVASENEILKAALNEIAQNTTELLKNL